MKSIIAALFLISSFQAFASEKIIECLKKSNKTEVMHLTYESINFQVKSVTLFTANLEVDTDAKELQSIGQMFWQNFSFLVALPEGRSVIVPFSVFTNSASSEVILDGSVHYKCL